VAILYRVNLQSRAIEDALREMGLPYHIVGGVSFYQRKEIKDIIAYVRLVLNHEDNVSLRRIINTPARGIGAATLTKIENEAKKQSICLYDAIKHGIKGNGIIASTREKLSTFVNLIDKLSSVHYKSAGDLLKAIMDKIDCLGQLDEERRQNVTELMVSGEGRDMQDFLDKVSLMSSHEQAASSNIISLMTLHNAKGLEFPVVFLSGMEGRMLKPLGIEIDRDHVPIRPHPGREPAGDGTAPGTDLQAAGADHLGRAVRRVPAAFAVWPEHGVRRLDERLAVGAGHSRYDLS
jgi:DNA helicase-2/ATP-dependent DNA helicase PcrA